MARVADATLPPLIAAQLNYLLTNSPLSVKVDRIWSGCKNSNLSDRFTLLIPMCLDYIKWDVIYNAHYPLSAPDIIFAAEDENFHPFFVIGEGEGGVSMIKNSLCDWNSKDPSRLLLLIHELRDHYILYQRKRVGEVDDDRLKFEISTIFSREGIEVCMVSGSDKPEEVRFAVSLLDVDLNKMVHGCPWRHQQKIFLQVIFPVIRKYSSAPSAPRLKLISSPELKALFSIEDVKLPPWLDGMCMAEYLPTLEENLNMQIVDAVASIGARRRFIEALAPLFGRPIEADPIFCRKATILTSSGVFIFLVHFSLSSQFPRQQPVLMLQSTQGGFMFIHTGPPFIARLVGTSRHRSHGVTENLIDGTCKAYTLRVQQHFNTHGTPVMSPPLTNYPWSPRWDTSQMAERIYEFLMEECLNFKKYCNDCLL